MPYFLKALKKCKMEIHYPNTRAEEMIFIRKLTFTQIKELSLKGGGNKERIF